MVFKNSFTDPSNKLPSTEAVESSSPLRLVIIVALSAFIVEAFVMVILSLLPPNPLWAEAIIDATLLVLLLSPALFFFLLRPLIQHIT